MSDISGLSHNSIQKLSDTFLKVESDLPNGCSRQLIINALVSLEAINEQRSRKFIDAAPYQTEVKFLQNQNKNRENQCYVVVQ